MVRAGTRQRSTKRSEAGDTFGAEQAGSTPRPPASCSVFRAHVRVGVWLCAVPDVHVRRVAEMDARTAASTTTTCVKLRTWTEIDNKRLSYIFEDEQGEPVRDFARDLIRKCLNGDRSKQPQTMAEVLQHPFLNASGIMEITRRASANLDGGGGGGGTRGRKARLARGPADSVYPHGSYASSSASATTRAPAWTWRRAACAT